MKQSLKQNLPHEFLWGLNEIIHSKCGKDWRLPHPTSAPSFLTVNPDILEGWQCAPLNNYTILPCRQEWPFDVSRSCVLVGRRHDREAWFFCLSLFFFFIVWNTDVTVGATVQLWSKLEDGNHVLRMMEQKKGRNLSSWWWCGTACHGLPTSDFFYIRKNKLLSCKALIWGLSVKCSQT